MVPRRTFHKLLSITAISLFTVVAVFVYLVPAVSSRSAKLEHDLDQHFLAYESLQLDPATALQQVQKTGRLSLSTSDLKFDLELVPHDLRASDYRAEMFGADGVAQTIDIGPVHTFKGRARGAENGEQLPQLGEARFTISASGVEGLIITPTEQYFVEPAKNFSDAAATSDYVIYRESDLLTSSTGECGLTLSDQITESAEAIKRKNAQTLNPSVQAGPAPINDSFSNAQIISSSSGNVVGTNVGATKESGEPNHGGSAGGASVWYVWQAPLSGEVTLTTIGSSFDTLLGVYTGSTVSFLTTISGDDDDASGLQSTVFFNASSGTHYYIAIDGFNAATGSVVLNWNLNASTPSPSPTPTPFPTPTPTPNPSPIPLHELRLATEADNEYVLAKGGSAAADLALLSIMNQVEGIFEVELGLTIKVVYQSTWSTPADPYSATNPSAVLGELTNHWNSNRGSVARDVVHMWTGKQLDNASIGTAYLAALCRFGQGQAAYGLSAEVTLPQQITVTAHELGHNLGATHPNQQVPPVAECSDSVMNSSVGTNSHVSFCQYSRSQITTYLSATGCLESGTTQLSFLVSTNYPVGEFPSSIATGDFNGDGKDDLAVTNWVGASVSVLLGSDSGTLKPAVNYPTGTLPNTVVVGDFNNDGKQDLAVTNGGANTVSVLLGTGTGDFQPQVSYPSDGSPGNAAVGDLNGDSQLDLVTVTFFPNLQARLTILLGNGMGQLQPPVHYSVAQTPQMVAVGEFNGDARLDLVAASNNNELSVLLGNDSGGLDTPVSFSSGGTFLNSLVVGDINNDGKQDLIVSNGAEKRVSVFFGTGTGDFQPPVMQLVESFPQALTVSDLNNDSWQDLAVIRSQNDSVTILLGDGTGTFKVAADYPIGTFSRGLLVADFNGDGNQDLTLTNELEDTVGVFLGIGGGAFAAAPTYRIGESPQEVAVGDLNGDGKQDLATPNNGSNNVSVLFGTGMGTFQSAINYPAGSLPSSLVIGDFNRDNSQDIVVANSGGDSVGVLLNTGTGTFQAMTSYEVDAPFNLATADVNDDGKQDVVATVRSMNGVLIGVLLGTGNGGFQPTTYYFGSSSNGGMGAVELADLNGDGKQDVVIANRDRHNVSVLLGTGTGTFHSPTNYAVDKTPTSVAVGDFNQDGRADVAVCSPVSGNISVLLGTGTGTLRPATNYRAGSLPSSIEVGDFNVDGKQDLVVSNPQMEESSHITSLNVLLGDGAGGFRVGGIYLVGASPNSMAVGDFNQDSKQDLAVTQNADRFNDGGLTILLNTSGQSRTGPFNDSFLAARVIRGPMGTVPGSTVLATIEPGEPDHVSGSNDEIGASIWYRWTAPSAGRFYFQTFSSNFPNVVAVYTGASVGALTNVARSTTAVPEYVEFDATGGTTYHIAIDGLTGDTGRTVLTWNTGSLSNDDFEFGREIRGSSGSVNGNNTNFTLETNEPMLPGPGASGFSAWYRWTAPNTGKVSFLATPLAPTPCGDTNRLLGAYTGNFIDVLSPVAVNFDGYRDFDDPGVCDNRSLRFNAIAGTTYRIQLRSALGKPFTLSWNYANPPPNDNFVNTLILAGPSGSLVGTNRDATKEPGEPNHAGGPGGASIWYRWTAPSSGPVTFDTIGFRNQTTNSFRYLTALIAVYTGSDLNALTSVVTNATDNKVTFNATAGTTYQIAVDSAPYTGGGYLPGIVPLHWGGKQVANDDFVNAQPLTASGTYVPLLGSNAGAAKETGEPNHQGSVGGTSVWYRWTALTTGNVGFVLQPCATCTLPTNNARVGVYTGSNVNALTAVPVTADSNHTFVATRGATYFIAVDSQTGSGGTYEFSLVSANISARNDAFANAQVLSGNAGAVAGDNAGASKEVAEPNHANDIGGASVWYQWKAPASGLYTFDSFGSNFDTLLGVYTGNVVSALTVVASSDNAGSSQQSRITFDVKLNTTYFIAVDGKSNGVEQGTGLARSQTGFILLNWNNLPPPVNDNFADAETLTGTAGNVSGRNTVASKEGGEPNHAGGPGGASVWYQWTAPSSGNFTFNTFGSDFNTLLGVYTGNALTALTSISSNDDIGGLSQSRVTFNAVAGTVYYIAVDGSPGLPGSVTPFSGNVMLSWFPETGVSNDNFLLAQPLSGSAGSLAATNAGATKEAGEPNHANDRGGRSVWYSWTAPVTGPVLFTTAGSDFDTLLAIYTGTTLNQLTPVTSNDDSPYSDNLGHILTSSLTFTATAGTTYRIVVDGSGGRFGNFALRWGPDAKISGQVSFIGGVCGSDKKVTMLLSGEDTRAVTFTGSGTYTFEHLRVGGNYSVRGISEISANCLPLFLERAQNSFPLAGNVLDANFVDDGLRGGGSTSNITGHVQTAGGVGLPNIAIALSGSASRTVYTDNAGLYLLPNLPAGTYQVTPSKAGVVFTPASRAFTFTSGQTITDADFATQDSFNISGQTRAQNGVALSGVTITLNNGTQPVATQTDGTGYYAFDAMAGGSYTLTAAKAGLSFTPATQSIATLNANQKNKDFTVSQTFTLTVTSANPGTGVPITVSPTDSNGQTNGSTQFTRTYSANTNVNLTAPATAGGNNFQKWLKDGADFSTNPSTSVTMDANHTLTAVYVTPTRTLTVASANPGSGVNITATPNDNNNQGGGPTQFTRTYNLNSNVTLTAPATAGSNVFQKWLKDGADYSTSVATSVLLDTDHAMTAVYLTTSAQTPAGQNVAVQLNGVKVTFASVTGAGTTTITPFSPAAAGQLPNGYQLTGDSIAFDISTTATVQPPISVCFNLPLITDATVFGQLRLLHNENGVLVDRTATLDFANKLICATVTSLSPFVLASSSLPLLQLLLEESGATSTQAAALDAVLLLRDPFPVVNSGNLLNPGTDHNTRVLVFVKNLQLQAGETAAVVTVNLVDSGGHSYDIVADGLWAMPSFEFSQLTFRLPDGLSPGSCTVQIKAHGQVSNVGTIRISP